MLISAFGTHTIENTACTGYDENHLQQSHDGDPLIVARHEFNYPVQFPITYWRSILICCCQSPGLLCSFRPRSIHILQIRAQWKSKLPVIELKAWKAGLRSNLVPVARVAVFLHLFEAVRLIHFRNQPAEVYLLVFDTYFECVSLIDCC